MRIAQRHREGLVPHQLVAFEQRPTGAAVYYILTRRQPYHDLGPDYFARRHSREHHTRRLVRQLQALGYNVTLQPTEVAA
jgi:hypothetical protein